MKQGFFQALGVAIYCTLVGIFIWNANHWLGPMNNFFGPILFLIIFSTSALICAIIVFLKPYKLFFAGKKKEAVNTVIFTAGWLIIFLLASLGLTIIFK